MNSAKKEVGFVAESSKKDAPPVKAEKPESSFEDGDNILEENFENILKTTIPSKPSASGLLNEEFSKIVTDNDSGGKKTNLPQTSLKDLGTWEKHTKGYIFYKLYGFLAT